MAAVHVHEVRIQAEEVQPAADGRPEAKSNNGHSGVTIDGNGNGNGALPSEAELARLGYVKMTAQAHSAPLEFSGGLLPESAQADTYEDASKARCGALVTHLAAAAVALSARACAGR